MLGKFIETYGNIQHKIEIVIKDLELFKNDLPAELYGLLKQGAGSYMNGFFWVVNPVEYKDLLNETYLPLQQPSICFGRDAFGCLYVWEDNSIIYIDINNTKQEVVGRKMNVFLDLKMTDKGFLDKRLKYSKFTPALNKLGELAFDECYGYTPLLGLGGAEKVENLKKVKIKEYISITAQALGKIR